MGTRSTRSSKRKNASLSHRTSNIVSKTPDGIHHKKTTFRGFSSDNPYISARLGSSLRSIYKRLTQRGGGIFIRWYCRNSHWRILEQGPLDQYWSRVTRHRKRSVLYCNATSTTGENCWCQSSWCNKNQWSWWGDFRRLTSRRTFP